MILKGTLTAIITPFDNNDNVDYSALKKIIENQVIRKVEGVVPCGTTGESPTLDHKEHREVIAKTIQWSKEMNRDFIVAAGTGSNSTKEAIDLTKGAAADGADYALVVNPYYNKPTQEGLIRHFSAIADNSKIPLILYNIPGRTAVSLSIESIEKLSRHGNIAGIKEATGDLSFMLRVMEVIPEGFSLLSGDDNLILPILSIGGKGVISVLSNIYPGRVAIMVRNYMENKTDTAKKEFYNLLPLMRAMFLETNPIPVKYAMSCLNYCQNNLRLPMTSLSLAYHETINEHLNRIGKDQ